MRIGDLRDDNFVLGTKVGEKMTSGRKNQGQVDYEHRPI